MKIALQLYSVRDDMAKDFEGTLAKVKEMGYEGGELAGLYGKSAKEVKELFAKIGLNPISAHVPYQELKEDMEKTLDTYKEIGCKYVVIPYLPAEYRYGAPKYDEVVENMKKIGKLCNEKGMTLLYHNHDFEFEKNEKGEYHLDVLYNDVPEDLLKTEIDTCWVNVGGVNPSDYVRKYSGRAPIVHLKDFSGGKSDNMYKLIGIDSEDDGSDKNAFEFRPLGMGKQNFPSIIEASKDAGALWVVVEQDDPSLNKTPLECAKISIDYMNQIGY